MSLYRQLVRHTATYSLAVVISRLASFLLLPVYTRFLTPTAYGLLEVLEVVNFVFSALIGSHLGAGLAYFYSRAKNEEEQLEAVHTAVIGAHMIAAVASGVGWFLAPYVSQAFFQTPEYTIHCRVTFINLSIALAQEMGLVLLRVQNRSATYVRVLTARLGLLVAMNVTLLTVFHLGALAMLLGATVSNVLIALYLDFRNLAGLRWRFRLGLFKEQLRYAYPVGLSALGMTFIHSGDRFFLQRHVSLFEVGLYGMAYKFGTLAGYIQSTFETYWNAQIFDVMKLESGEKYYARTLTYFALVSAGAAVAVGLFSQPVVRVMTPEQFHRAMLLSPLIAACYAWRGVGDYFRNTFALHRKTGRNIVVTLSGVILAATSYSLLIPRWKLWGAAIGTAITFIGMNIVSYREAQKVCRYQFEWRRLWTIVVCAILVLLPTPLLVRMGIINQFLCATVLTLLFPVLLWIAGFFEEEEVRSVVSYLRDGRKLIADKMRTATAA